MAALTAARRVLRKTINSAKLPSTQEQVYQGGEACWDTATGLVKKATASTTLVPIGTYMETKLVGASDPTVQVQLHREVKCRYFANSAADPVDADDIGDIVYLEDDQTVRETDATNTHSVAGRCWGLDANGVLVEPVQTATHRIGGLDA